MEFLLVYSWHLELFFIYPRKKNDKNKGAPQNERNSQHVKTKNKQMQDGLVYYINFIFL